MSKLLGLLAGATLLLGAAGAADAHWHGGYGHGYGHGYHHYYYGGDYYPWGGYYHYGYRPYWHHGYHHHW
jgi:hypothetical protein